VVEEGKLVGLHPIFFGPQHTLVTGTPVPLDMPPAGIADPEDFRNWVSSFYSWDVYKVLIEQKENTDPAYVFPDKRGEPLNVHAEDLTPAQQTSDKEIEQRLRERLPAR